MSKKIIAVFLVFVMSGNVLLASNLNSLISNVSTSTGSWQSPKTGMKYHYGGSYQFTFKGGNRFQPLVTSGKPEFKVGCNGISMKGGFLGLLGLNEIKDQLKNAGASLAWGVMIGLQYAMPALFQIFDKIRVWATTIQRMLQNACQIGKMVGKDINPWSQDSKKRVTDEQSKKDGTGTWLDDQTKGIDGFFTAIDKFVDCSSLSGDALKKCLGKLAPKIIDKSKKASTSIISSVGGGSILTRDIFLGPKSINKLKTTKLSNLASTGTVDGLVYITPTNLSETILTYKILRVFFGDVSISKVSFDKMIARDTMHTGYVGGTYSINLEEVKSGMKADASGVTVGQDEKKLTFNVIYPIISAPEVAAKALIHGFDTNTDISKCTLGKCKIKEGYVFYSDFAVPLGTGTEEDRTIAYGIIADIDNTEPSELELEWKGAKIESLNSIRTLVKSKSNITPFRIAQNETTIKQNHQSTTIPLLLPNIDKYIEIISKIERDKGEETPLSAHLKEQLADYNAFFVTTSLINLMHGKIIEAQNSPLGSVTEEGLLMMAEFSKNLEELKREINKQLRVELNEKVDYEKLNNLFDRLGNNLKNKTIKRF